MLGDWFIAHQNQWTQNSNQKRRERVNGPWLKIILSIYRFQGQDGAFTLERLRCSIPTPLFLHLIQIHPLFSLLHLDSPFPSSLSFFSAALQCLSPLCPSFLLPIPPSPLISFSTLRPCVPLFLLLSTAPHISVPPSPLSLFLYLFPLWSLLLRSLPTFSSLFLLLFLVCPCSHSSIPSFSPPPSEAPFLSFLFCSLSPPLLSFFLTSPASSLTFNSTSSSLLSILPPQPSSLPHFLRSLRLPSSAPPAVSYSDSDIITLVVTGFICTLWTYTSAWLIVRGPGPAEPRPSWDRVTDRMVLKTTPARVPLDIFPLLVLICQTQCSVQTRPKLQPAWNNNLRQFLINKYPVWLNKGKKRNSKWKDVKVALALFDWQVICGKWFTEKLWVLSNSNIIKCGI